MSKYLLTNSKMYDTTKNNLIYNNFLDFKQSFFKDGVSFFDKNIKLFDDDEVFREFERRIIQNYDASGKKSIEKYIDQLSNSSEKMRHFFANIVWLYNFPIYDKKKSTKISEIETYLGDYNNKGMVEKSMQYSGVASYGLLSQYIYYDINFIYFFTKQYIKSKGNPNSILNDLKLSPLMRELTTESIKNMKFLASKHILNYLFDPDYYEPIVDTSCKRKIVEKFLKSSNDISLDDDLYKIRNEGFGFTSSLYDDVCGNQALTKEIKLIQHTVNGTNNYSISIHSKNNDEDDLLLMAEKKIINGENAELLVYEEVVKTTDTNVLIKQIGKILNLKGNEYNTVLSNISQLIHYSANYDKFAPFDLISTRGQEILYIEVKSTTGNKIYFSKSEIIFAYNHLENYQVKVVKDSQIYDININKQIQEIYTSILESNPIWTFETIVLKLNI